MKSGQWVQYISLALAFIGMLVSGVGSLLFFSYQAQVGSSLWPLPGLVLIDWAILGVLGLLGVYFEIKLSSGYWPRVPWFVSGALLPLINWLNALGVAMLGAVCNLGLVYLFIVVNSAIQS
jgi:hypothetical protein